MFKFLLTRSLKKREDEVWSVYEMFGARKVERVNWLHAAMYRDWEQRTGRVQGIVLLSTENLVFCLGIDYEEMPLKSITKIDWAADDDSVVLVATDQHGHASGAEFDFNVPGQRGTNALGLKRLFGSQLLRQIQLAQPEQEA
jgi:hypothetical protein